MARRDSDARVIVVDRGGGSFTWLLAGAALGAGLALLFAPAEGAETRRRLGKQFGRLKDTAGAALEELREAVDPDLSVARPRGADEGGVNEEAEAEDAPRRRGESARAELERRLTAARARRQHALAAEDEEPAT